MRRGAWALFAVACLLVPGSAHAGTVRVDNVQVSFVAADGEQNEVSVSRPDGYVVDIHDNRPIAIAPGEPCVHPSASQPDYVRCHADGLNLLGGYEVDLGDGNDVFSAGGNWIYLGRVYAGPGNDIVHGPTGTAAQSLQYGGPGNDQIFLYTASWGAHGEEGADTITGSPDPDTIHGEAGNDTLRGMGGDDQLIGGINRDTVEGGAGSDTMSYLYDGRSGPVSVSTAEGVDDEGSTEDCTPLTFCRAGSGHDVVTDVEAWQGSVFSDTMTGGDGPDSFDGDEGNDSITGAGGDDHLDGGSGEDSLNGGAGADWMAGGSGGGTDVLDYSARTAPVVIRPDQGPGSGESGGAEGDEVGGFEEVHGGQAGDDIRVGCRNELFCGPIQLVKGGPGGDTVRVTCLPPPEDYACGRANRVDGDGGDDTVVNDGPGAQTINGGEGDETIVAGAGADEIDGGPGVDDIESGAGADKIAARDSTAEPMACGADADEATTDSSDAIDADCEKVALMMLASPAISGQPIRGADIAVSDGSWFGRPQTAKSIQWQRCPVAGGACAAIPGATTRSYRVVLADVDYRLRAVVSVPHPMGGEQASATTGVVKAVTPASAPAVVPPGPAAGAKAPADTRVPTQAARASGGRLRTLTKRGLRVNLVASEAGRFAATLSLPRATAKRLRIARAVPIARGTKRTPRSGRLTLRLKLNTRARRALARSRGLTLTLRVTFTDVAGNSARPITRRLRFRG